MNKVSGSILAGAAIALLASAFAAADAPAEAPKPTAEHKKLGYFVGEWKTEGEWKPGAMGAGGKASSHDKCEWFEGGFSVICRGDNQTPMGPSKSLAVLNYSAEDKVYTYYSTESNGMTMMSIPRGTRQGDTWTYTDESPMGGQMVKSRVVIKEVSPTQYTFVMEMEGKDGKWATLMETKSTKVK